LATEKKVSPKITGHHPYCPYIGDWNFLGVEGSVKPKQLKKSMKLNWNFQRVGGLTPCRRTGTRCGRRGYFLELHISMFG